jgi:hypothetical protein
VHLCSFIARSADYQLGRVSIGCLCRLLFLRVFTLRIHDGHESVVDRTACPPGGHAATLLSGAVGARPG